MSLEVVSVDSLVQYAAENRVRILRAPKLGADTDEYFKPGKVFEVVEEFAIGGRSFLCLPDGRFVSDRSRKDIQKVVAKRLEVSTGKCPKSVRR